MTDRQSARLDVRAVPGDVLSFTVAGQAMAMAAADIAEIVRVPALTPVPNAPAAVLGMAGWRGRVIAVVALADLLGLAWSPGAAGTPGARLLVLGGGAAIGVLVDSVASMSAGHGQGLLDARALVDRAALAPRAAMRPVDVAEPGGRRAGSAGRVALVTFRLGGAPYAMRLDEVAGVAQLPALQASGDGVLGMMRAGGGAVPVVALADWLGLARPASGKATHVVTVLVEGAPFGLAVEGPPGLVHVAPDAGDGKVDGVRLLSAAELFDAPMATRLRDHPQASRLLAPAGLDDGGLAEAGMRRRIVLFRVGAARYGLAADAVREVVRRPGTLTRMPHAPGFVEGVMNLRGRAVPVIDLAQRLAGAGRTAGARQVIVVSVAGAQTGLAVDAVIGLREVAESACPLASLDGTGAAVQLVDGPVRLVCPAGLLAAAERDVARGWPARAAG